MRRQEGHKPARKARVALLAAAAGAVAAAAVTFAASPGAASRHGAAMPALQAQAASRREANPAAPLRVLSISPGSSADAVSAADPVRVVFSAALAPSSPLPTFSPAVAGTWHAVGGGTMLFTPASQLAPTTQETLRVPAGPAGVRSATGGPLATPATAVFQSGGWSTLRLERLLAQLGYLPLTWAQRAGPVAVSDVEQRSAVSTAPVGVLSWASGYPSALTSQWQPGQPSVILTGALMAFQSDHGLPMTGTATKGLWRALLKAAAQGQDSPYGYSFALVSKALPETLTVWHDGHIVVHGLANTGTPQTPTIDGTFPVYLRNRSQVMRGLMPNGTPYADPVNFVSYFHGDFAVHSMVRPSYGSPQSLGCVELPLSEARQVWPYLTYGTLVTVTG